MHLFARFAMCMQRKGRTFAELATDGDEKHHRGYLQFHLSSRCGSQARDNSYRSEASFRHRWKRDGKLPFRDEQLPCKAVDTTAQGSDEQCVGTDIR